MRRSPVHQVPTPCPNARCIRGGVEGKLRLPIQLFLPLLDEASRCTDQGTFALTSKHDFPVDQASNDGLSAAKVVGEKRVKKRGKANVRRLRDEP
ncbi:MAG: hypothetical protein PVI86_16005 [Phycisphaerae bacterium]|jgi:hypothetical protein